MSQTSGRPNYALHAILLVATCTTTYLAGGIAFSATLMSILLCHEMGHYVVARRNGIDASLPYFIPLPPQIFLAGTMGAVISMRRPMEDRNQLIDVGAAGPLAGLVVAIPLLVIGLYLSPVEQSNVEGALVEGNSLAYIGLKYMVHGLYLPAANGLDVQLHPMAFAAWFGLLVTMINLIPIGQLDGGHIARAYFGDAHERLSAWLHRGLVVVGVLVIAYLVYEARSTGQPWGEVISYGLSGAPWLIWALLLLGFRWWSGGVYHPPVGGGSLSGGRRMLAFFMAVIFVLIFTPIPLRQVLLP